MVLSNQDSIAEFGLAYDGEALAENTMDVRDLAPALLALGELFTRANSILNGGSISVSLKVRATKPGSFELLLVLAAVLQATTQFLTGDLITSAVNLKNLLVGSPLRVETLFSVFKKLKGQKPTVSQQTDGVTLEATNLKLFVPTDVFRLYQDREVSRLAQAIVEPVLRAGIDRMVIKEGDKEVESVTKEDAATFTPMTASDNTATENVIPNLALRLVSPTFSIRRNKWKLDDGGGSKWYSIEDQKFLDEVKDHKRRFGMGDYLICRVRNTQRVTDAGLEMERAILLVLEHRRAGEQLRLATTTDQPFS
ncbi:MAG: hypothetical protein HYX81_02080 [Chloroflexi bacterium]|nr:hypothetical protein [Chloroflexota bacterium]